MRVLPEIKISPPSSERFLSEKKGGKTLSSKAIYALGLAGIVGLSLTFVLIITTLGLKSAMLMLVLLVAVPACVAVIAYPKVGILILLIAAYFIMWIIRMRVNFPLGTVMDGLQVLLIFTFLLHQKFHPDLTIFKTPIAIVLLIWVAYVLLQFLNPTAESRLAWVYTVRTVAFVSLSYFVFSYFVKTLSFVKLILNIWMILSVIGAINAFKQQYFGFFAFEEPDASDPLVVSLMFINGEWRKFSIFSDPVSFSYNMAISAIYCICIVGGPFSIRKKTVYTVMGALFTAAMLFSATRGAYVLIPAAIMLYIVLNLNRRVLAFGIITGMCMMVLINIPTSNLTLSRFQSAFRPSDDASFNVRKENQKRIQPYIRSHPLGGGLGATGVWGKRFAPHSFLAQFPPDSGYVRVAVELGWVGLFLLCSLFFIVLKQGIRNYFRIRDPELKTYCLAMILIIFALNIGNYPQEALVQFPVNIFFLLFIALINILFMLDQQKQKEMLSNI